MRLAVTLSLAVGTAVPALGAVYHVSPTGDDTRAGTSRSEAWRTVSRVNAGSFACGDSILFERGGVWRELLSPPSGCTVPGQTITWGAYGPERERLPRITGADVVAGWEPAGPPGVWQASFGGPSEPHVLTVDGRLAYWRSDPSALSPAHPNEWSWSSGTLYLHSPIDPDSLLVEAGQRRAAVDWDGSEIHGLTFENLHFSHGNSTDAIEPAVTQIEGILDVENLGGAVTIRDCLFTVGRDLSNHFTAGFEARLTNGAVAKGQRPGSTFTVERSHFVDVGHGVICGGLGTCTIRHSVFVRPDDDCIWLHNAGVPDGPVHRIESNLCVDGHDDGIQPDQSAVIVGNTIVRPSNNAIFIGHDGTEYTIRNNLFYEPQWAHGQQQGNGAAVVYDSPSHVATDSDHNLVYKVVPRLVDEDFEGCAVDPFWTGSTGGAVAAHARSGVCSYTSGVLSRTWSPRADPRRLFAMDFWLRIDPRSSLAPGSAVEAGRFTWSDGSVFAFWILTDGGGVAHGILALGDDEPDLAAYCADPAVDSSCSPMEPGRYYEFRIRKNGYAASSASRIWLHRSYGEPSGAVRRECTLDPGPLSGDLGSIELGAISGDTAEILFHVDDVIVHERLPELLWVGGASYGGPETPARWQSGRFQWDRHSLFQVDPRLRTSSLPCRLLPSSPAIDAGIDMADPAAVDLRGVPRGLGASWDIGACEHRPRRERSTTGRGARRPAPIPRTPGAP
jgi:hypothetical protein